MNTLRCLTGCLLLLVHGSAWADRQRVFVLTDIYGLQYSRLLVEPKHLKRGLNRIELLSDTEHHGIEVIYPGPALMVRYRLEER